MRSTKAKRDAVEAAFDYSDPHHVNVLTVVVKTVEMQDSIRGLASVCFPIDEGQTAYWADVSELFDVLINDSEAYTNLEFGTWAPLLHMVVDTKNDSVDVIHFHME